MGTVHAPSFADFFLDWWGDIFCKDLILYSQHIFGHNIWILLDSTRALFVDSVQILNQETFGLKFTFELNKRKSFLGVD